MRITMIGHSTVLIEAAGKRILTDPYFGLKGNVAYARIAPPSRKREELKNVDVVLVSHNHFDHTDRRYFRSLDADVPVVAPQGEAWLTRMKGAKNVIGLATWEQKQFGDVRVTAVPATHLSPSPRGFIIEAEGKTLYFAGDTYYRETMKEIAKRFPLDVAVMPVASFRLPPTMGEKGAVRAASSLAPKVIIPMHLGLKPRSPFLRTSQTAETFRKRAREAGLKSEVKLLREGESWDA